MSDYINKTASKLELKSNIVCMAQYFCHVHKRVPGADVSEQQVHYTACLSIAAKVCNKHRSLNDFVNAFYDLKYGSEITAPQLQHIIT